MSECKIDHSFEDVRQKYEDQKKFLPEDLNSLFVNFFAKEHSQAILNQVFHLLKKYDLASVEEREERNRKLYTVVQNT